MPSANARAMTRYDARRRLQEDGNYFGAIMVEQGDADALLSGINAHYPDVILPAIEVVGKKDGLSKVHGLYMMVFKQEVIFCADTTVTIEPTAEELAETAILAAEQAEHFDITPTRCHALLFQLRQCPASIDPEGEKSNRTG